MQLHICVAYPYTCLACSLPPYNEVISRAQLTRSLHLSSHFCSNLRVGSLITSLCLRSFATLRGCLSRALGAYRELYLKQQVSSCCHKQQQKGRLPLLCLGTTAGSTGYYLGDSTNHISGFLGNWIWSILVYCSSWWSERVVSLFALVAQRKSAE